MSLSKQYKNILNNEKLYYNIYDIETIGHEFGHTLWLYEDSEVVMNKGGNFKNIEEFKATTGGLMAYFMKDKQDEEVLKNMMILHTMRTISLLKYKKIIEILPYYNEALIHLHILYNSGFLKINDTKLDVDFKKIDNVKKIYNGIYNELINVYLNKMDANNFLYKYVVSEENENYPKDNFLNNFVKKYYHLYEKYGNKI